MSITHVFPAFATRRPVQVAALLGVALGAAAGAAASPVVAEFGTLSEPIVPDVVAPLGPVVAWSENGITFTLLRGHTDLTIQGVPEPGEDGDGALQIDDADFYFGEAPPGLSTLSILEITFETPLFDLVSLDVVVAGGSAFRITTDGGADIAAPDVTGPFAFGPAFRGVGSVTFTQVAPGFFAFDTVTVAPVPLPATAPLLLAGLGAVALLRWRR